MNSIYAMWSHPRSMSTAIERLMSERGDMHCLHEPFMYYHYLEKKKRDMPFFQPAEDHPVTYEGVRQSILDKATTSPVFFKDMSYYVQQETLTDKEFNERVTHTFLIRNPRASIASYFKLDNGFTLEEVGIEAQWLQYSHLKSMGLKPVVIQAESIAADIPAYVARWWKAIELVYTDKAFEWSEEHPTDWGPVESWHSDAIASTSIKARSSEDEEKERERFNRAKQTAPHLQKYWEHHQRFYEYLKADAL